MKKVHFPAQCNEKDCKARKEREPLSPPRGPIFCGNRGEFRPSWPETWMNIAKIISERSYDPGLQVGAIIVSCDNTQMLSMGYNGNYKGGPHKHESSEPGKSGYVHAEANSCVKCDFNFPKPKHMYVTHSPCRACCKIIINAEIARVIYDVEYRDTSGLALLTSVGIEVQSLQDAILSAKVR